MIYLSKFEVVMIPVEKILWNDWSTKPLPDSRSRTLPTRWGGFESDLNLNFGFHEESCAVVINNKPERHTEIFILGVYVSW